MTRKLLFLVLVVIIGTTGVMAEKFATVKKNGVNLREQPGTASAVVGKATKGMIFIVLDSSNGWTHVKDVVNGKEVYVSSPLVNVLPDYAAPNAEQLLSQKESEVGYESIEKGKNSELISQWLFWEKTPDSKIVEACLSMRYCDTSGHLRTNESYYRGVLKPYCIVLMETTDWEGENAENLEEPIVIYGASVNETGIYVNGVFFIDQGSMEYGM